jgi:dipeptidyl aminopeptidase/acylaminoacyl peptidase
LQFATGNGLKRAKTARNRKEQKLMCKRLPWLLALAAVLFPCDGFAAGQSRPHPHSVDRVLDSLFQARRFKEVAISPAGDRAAWVETLPGEKDASRTAIFVVDLKGNSPKPRRVTAGTGARTYTENGLAWSPDGSRLAFLSDKEKKDQLQVYVAAADGAGALRLTNLKGFLASPRWSPDGKLLAFLFTENSPRAAGPLQPRTPDVGVVEEHVYEQRLTVVDLKTRACRQLSPEDIYVYEFDWSPDSKSAAVIAAHGSGDNNWYIAQLYTLDIGSGKMKSILKPDMQIAVPRWSPDGKAIAFIGGLMSDEGSNGGDIFLIPVGGGRPRNITPGMKGSASWLAWLPSSRGILFTQHIDGSSGIARVDPANPRTTSLWKGDETIKGEGGAFGLSLSQDQKTCALIRQSFQHPPEVWAGRVGEWKQVTHANAGLKPSWGEAKSLHWKSDSFNVQGWLLYPRDYNPRKRYPMIVSVHGGPASSRKPAWPRTFFDLAIFSSEGYFVFFPNPRGSFGQGERFTRANVKDFGHGDLRDILAGVDAIVKSLPVDEDRLGIAGWSYGGFMTMWAVTQTRRFGAAVAGAGIANWQSYYGQNGIDQWLIPYFGASVYDDPAVYARSSPITFIKKVKTPTLILVGDGDMECPVAQSYEFWHALKTLKVPNQFVIYPHEGHLISEPKHRRDIARRTAAWFQKHLAEGKGKK